MGVAKTCVILASDFIVFGRRADFRSIAGMGVSIAGVITYTVLKLNPQYQQLPAGVSLGGVSSFSRSTWVKVGVLALLLLGIPALVWYNRLQVLEILWLQVI